MRPVISLLLLTVSLFAQKPVINPGGVVNAASFANATGPTHGLVPGSIATLFGKNLAAATQSATSFPLVPLLGGASVSVGGFQAPLLYVSPGQINFQVPHELINSFPGCGNYYQAPVTVTTAAGASDPVTVDLSCVSPGIFTQDGSGCGRGAILNVKPDGTRSLNSPADSASPGDFIEIYGTGLDQSYNVPPDGVPALANPLATSEFFSGVYFGLTDILETGNTTFAGEAPGLVGVDQVDLQIPANVRQGCNVPVQLNSFAGGLSQPVTVSIHSGGGQCANPPIAGGGVLLLKRSIVVNDSTIPETDTVTASFTASPGQTAPVFPKLDGIPGFGIPGNLFVTQGPACPVPGYSTPNPGAITITAPGGAQVKVQPSPGPSTGLDTGTPVYQASLPAGFLQAGTYQVSGGGVDTGAFQVSIDMGSPIQILTQTPDRSGPHQDSVAYTGGQPGTMIVWEMFGIGGAFDAVCADTISLDSGTAGPPDLRCPPVGGTGYEIDVLVEPDYTTKPLPVVQVPGLSLGLQLLWIIEYRFIGLQP